MIREIFGKKLGMTQVFDKEGSLLGATVVEVDPVCILESFERAGKRIARIGCFRYEEKKLNKVKKPLQGYFKKMNTVPYKLIREVELAIDNKASTKQAPDDAGATGEVKEERKEFGVDIFNEGDMVCVKGTTKGKGFAGGIKRHGWHGGPSSHGSMTHRRIGSNGANTDPGRVVRGHRMPGHMGCAWRVMKNLKVLRVDKEKNVLIISGSIPGHRGTVISIEKI
jgi:large subunit ribosomal protein L3